MESNNAPKAKHGKLLVTLLLVTVGMFVFAVGVLPPMYNAICDITGLNGKSSNEADSAADAIKEQDRVVTVQFLANTDPAMPWDFKPEQRSIKVHPGEITKVAFYAHNRNATDVIGQAIPSITPSEAAPHFKKTECFCFTQQELKGGDARDMPLIFYVDPDLPKYVTTITLSYTMFNITDRAKAETPAVAAIQ